MKIAESLTKFAEFAKMIAEKNDITFPDKKELYKSTIWLMCFYFKDIDMEDKLKKFFLFCKGITEDERLVTGNKEWLYRTVLWLLSQFAVGYYPNIKEVNQIEKLCSCHIKAIVAVLCDKCLKFDKEGILYPDDNF